MGILDAMKEGRLFFDGGMGSMLQAAGLPEGYLPDVWNIENPLEVEKVHLAYLKAGSRIITTNTFGVSEEKLKPYGYSVEDVMEAAIRNARKAIGEADVSAFVAADIGPTGRLLKPYGDLDFEDAVFHFKRVAQAAWRFGADCILVETMSDLYETKAAVLAARESTELPVFATVVFDEQGKLFTGGDPAGTVALLEGLGVSALGVNCGLGPQHLAPVVEEIWKYSSTPILYQPNAGLPKTQDGETVYDLGPEAFAREMGKLASKTALMGGCCGTTPEHIKALVDHCQGISLEEMERNNSLLISSYCQTVKLGEKPVIIGERINPTGKKKLQKALRERDMSYVLREALTQEEAGAHILDVNVGLPDLDEPKVLCETMEAIQSVSGLPLQLDTADPVAMERALRRYNGKPLVNSVNGKKESLDAILPLVKKYGGGLVCLTLDDEGIPETVEGRLAIARRIISAAEEHGISRRELLIDGLTMPVSAGDDNGIVTLETIRQAKETLGVKTALGVSNVSFGLPRHGLMNAAFFTMALDMGLDGAIINPNSEEMMGAYYAFCAIRGMDPQSQAYIGAFQNKTGEAAVPEPSQSLRLEDCVRKGLRGEAVLAATKEAGTVKIYAQKCLQNSAE